MSLKGRQWSVILDFDKKFDYNTWHSRDLKDPKNSSEKDG